MLLELRTAGAGGVALLLATGPVRAHQPSSSSALTAPGRPVPASTATATAQQFLAELVPAAAEWYPEAHRKSAHYDVACQHQPDYLSSTANLVSGLAKIMLAISALALMKLLMAKMFFLPAKMMFLAKIGIKSLLLYPIISKLVKLWKKKKHKKSLSKEVRSPVATDGCPALAACLLVRAARGSWRAQVATLAGLALDDERDDSYLLTLLEAISPGEVASCGAYQCDDRFTL